jgi:hypothetical protein
MGVDQLVTGGSVTDPVVDTLETEKAEIAEQIESTLSPHVIYVRSDGDDSADGLSPSSAVASVEEATTRILNLPVKGASGDLPSHVIDLPAGESIQMSSRIVLATPWAGMLRFRSSSDGQPATILTPSGVDKPLTFRHTRVSFKDIELHAGDTNNRPNRMLEATEGSSLGIRGASTITGASGDQINVDFVSYLELLGNAVVAGLGKGAGSNGIRTHGGSMAIVTGTVRDCQRAIYGTRNAAWALEVGGVIDNCTTAMRAGDTAVGKTAGSTIQNCDTAFDADTDGFLREGSGTTLTNLNTIVNNSGPNGSVYRTSNDRYISGSGVRYNDLASNLVHHIDEERLYNGVPVWQNPQDVRTTSPNKGWIAYHDPSISGDSNTEGPAFNDGSGWISLVDGSTIS